MTGLKIVEGAEGCRFKNSHLDVSYMRMNKSFDSKFLPILFGCSGLTRNRKSKREIHIHTEMGILVKIFTEDHLHTCVKPTYIWILVTYCLCR